MSEKKFFCCQRWIGRVKCIHDKGAESFLLKLEIFRIFSEKDELFENFPGKKI